MKINVDIVCATIDDDCLVNCFLKIVDTAVSTTRRYINYNLILVDQSFSSRHFDLYTPINYSLHHLRSDELGLSKNRNFGIANSSSEWIMFLDADSYPAEDYFAVFLELLTNFPHVDVFLGKIVAIESREPQFRNWPIVSKYLHDFDIWRYTTSINCIYKNNSINKFDERFGIGSEYGSCEDVDFALHATGVKLYSPDLIVFHPAQRLGEQPLNKVYSYAYGFGALCAKRALPYGILLLCTSVLIKIYQFAMGDLNKDVFFKGIAGRIQGFKRFVLLEL